MMSQRISVTEALPWIGSQIPYFVATEEGARLVDDLSTAGFDVRMLNGRRIHDERSLVRALGPAMSFPVYYGGNWDAFIDCVGDLAEVSDASVALVWTSADDLAKSDLHGFTRAIHLLLSTARNLALSEARFQFELFVVGDFARRES